MRRERTPFGQAIQKLRLDGNLSLAQMAETLGYSKAFVSATELGLCKPNDKYISKIADLFCIDSEDLLNLSKKSVYVNKQGLVQVKNKIVKDRSSTAAKLLSLINHLDDKTFKELELLINKLS